MTTQLREAIARLRKAHNRILLRDIIPVCDALEAQLNSAPKFDKVAYQREYMRNKRKRARMIRDSTRWLPRTEDEAAEDMDNGRNTGGR